MTKSIYELQDFANEDIDPKWERIAKSMSKKEKDYMKEYLEIKLKRLS